MDFFDFGVSYAEMGIGNKIGILIRAFYMLCSLVTVIIILYLTTNKHAFLTKIGTNSLAVYVLHFYFARILNEYFMSSYFRIMVKYSIILSIIYYNHYCSNYLHIIQRCCN
ncbi:hypothetical protein ALNOE001_04450 [Candidatus Methanobinarius endosymbioticus]|uniref:Uncharacterized protein n=1 Tax=Candidatus Methanobinarius endosymbioticus TaxID=2006182 RepID=A0A366MDC5_9EURY|nr:hypothetical protein ALNOE001_04450 [Candidatus Methanobinarius endosymbioticus]